MSLNLNSNEARVIGCLLEKSLTTPDQYPLTLNALTSACNQKSGRNPVMSMEQGAVQRAVRDLEANHLLSTDENFKSRVEKYSQRFCNTRYSEFQFDPPQMAIVCLLLLRGAQTPGELRARSARLFAFPDNAAVVDAVNGLIEREGEPLVMQLPRTAGRKDAEYMHLFCGAVDVDAHVSHAQSARAEGSSDRISMADLANRVSKLEEELAALKEQLAST